MGRFGHPRNLKNHRSNRGSYPFLLGNTFGWDVEAFTPEPPENHWANILITVSTLDPMPRHFNLKSGKQPSVRPGKTDIDSFSAQAGSKTPRKLVTTCTPGNHKPLPSVARAQQCWWLFPLQHKLASGTITKVGGHAASPDQPGSKNDQEPHNLKPLTLSSDPQQCPSRTPPPQP